MIASARFGFLPRTNKGNECIRNLKKLDILVPTLKIKNKLEVNPSYRFGLKSGPLLPQMFCTDKAMKFLTCNVPYKPHWMKTV